MDNIHELKLQENQKKQEMASYENPLVLIEVPHQRPPALWLAESDNELRERADEALGDNGKYDYQDEWEFDNPDSDKFYEPSMYEVICAIGHDLISLKTFTIPELKEFYKEQELNGWMGIHQGFKIHSLVAEFLGKE